MRTWKIVWQLQLKVGKQMPAFAISELAGQTECLAQHLTAFASKLQLVDNLSLSCAMVYKLQ